MSWGRYAQAADALVEELSELLGEEDRRALQAILRGMSWRQWADWMSAHGKLVHAYIASSPSQRARNARFRLERDQMLLLRCAALVKAKQGRAMLLGIRNSSLMVGSSYRDALSNAALLVDDVQWEFHPFWPFDDEPYPWT